MYRGTKIAIERNLEATMRDGTVLRADVYRPDSTERFPTILFRTPYDKQLEVSVEIARKLAERGYVLVLQDVRGRYASDGEFRPGLYSDDHCDAEDGYTTRSNGRRPVCPGLRARWERSVTHTAAGLSGNWHQRGRRTWLP